ncbi:DUF1566 domain-containing protein [Lamprobacter modestohalophilus]|uniref:Lcl C-terminal domain-containing protein n=1 Tax=Lamprobacter modestohalophilus TaxID=1064514 RepID=UPI002ADEB92D|nr:DUF1566 domain-containing protein [Lamprobacter modestohalophilus]MEA1053293.1 DUF1566 domain-containing protein [Lamprobacter modestohalophilus]
MYKLWPLVQGAEGPIPAQGFTSLLEPSCIQVAGIDVPPDEGSGGTPGAEYSASMPLNDTGITFCGEADSGNNRPCTGAEPVGQDAYVGRDAAAAAGQLTKVGSGHAGFDFTKIANNGSALPDTAVLGTGPTDWACTRDNVTGLIWEVKTDDGGLRDKDNTYTWYNPDSSTNGGYAGIPNGGSCTGSDCDTDGFVTAVNAQELCGATDWRLPDRFELGSIVIVDQTGPSIDVDLFPNTLPRQFRSALPYAGISDFAWTVDFYGGGVSAFRMNNDDAVRLVRGGQ